MENILDQPEANAKIVTYAGFWYRFLAAIIDGLILGVPQWFLYSMIEHNYKLSATNMNELFIISRIINVVGLIVTWLYSAIMESSKSQATIGKMVFNIVVTDMEGNRISFLNATGRNFAKYISALIFFIGYIMAAFTEKKQALHDKMAGTLVVRK